MSTATFLSSIVLLTLTVSAFALHMGPSPEQAGYVNDPPVRFSCIEPERNAEGIIRALFFEGRIPQRYIVQRDGCAVVKGGTVSFAGRVYVNDVMICPEDGS